MIALGTAAAALTIFLVTHSILSDRRSDKRAEWQNVELLYRLSQTRASDKLACIDIGYRWPAMVVAKHLTSGQMHAIEIYNPQLMPGRAASLIRQYAPPPISDPRLTWYDSNFDLLPLPDASVTAVFLYLVLSELSEEGDRRELLQEIHRILAPNGKLLFAEAAYTWPNRLRSWFDSKGVYSHGYWTELLSEAGFEMQRSQTNDGAVVCSRADKPSPYAGKQLALDLEFETY